MRWPRLTPQDLWMSDLVGSRRGSHGGAFGLRAVERIETEDPVVGFDMGLPAFGRDSIACPVLIDGVLVLFPSCRRI
jgi:hypothetical protein